MSDGELEKLAGLIADKLLSKQKEMDDEYMKMMFEAQVKKDTEAYGLEFISFDAAELLNEPSKEDRLAELREGLADALSKEDYMRAADIQTNIAKLESEDNQTDQEIN